MRIAVCDDREEDRRQLMDALMEELSHRRIAAEVQGFASGEAYLAAVTTGRFAITFLDIFMGGVSGVAVARRIRAGDENAAIVFTTTSPDYMADGFEVGAVHYLVKPYTAEALSVALDRCLQFVGEGERYVEFTANRQSVQIFLSHILCAEFRERYCVVRLKDGEELRPYLRLGELETLLDDPRFLRCHRSFLVNLDYVKEVRGTDFALTDGTLVPLRREERAALKARFERYLFEKARRRYSP